MGRRLGGFEGHVEVFSQLPLTHRDRRYLSGRNLPVNEFEHAEVRALARVLENWPTGDEADDERADDVAQFDSTSERSSGLRAPSGDTMNEWLSVERAGRALGIGVHTVYGLINRGELVAYRIGRVYRIRREDIAVFLESARVKPGDLQHLAPDTVGWSR